MKDYSPWESLDSEKIEALAGAIRIGIILADDHLSEGIESDTFYRVTCQEYLQCSFNSFLV